MKEVNAIVLAGGKSSRMGADKGLMKIGAKAMLQYLTDLLHSMDIHTIIIANNPEYEQFGLAVYPDFYVDKGPLAGIHSGLKHSKTEKSLVLSCDAPFISADTIRKLIDQSHEYDITVAQSGNKLHPLSAVYDKKCIPVIERLLAGKSLRVRGLLDEMKHHVVLFEDRPEEFTNINTPEEMKNLFRNVSVHFYGLIAEKMGRANEEVAVPVSSNPVDLRELFNQRFPVLKGLQYKIAVDHEITDLVPSGLRPFEIAVLPPFAGG